MEHTIRQECTESDDESLSGVDSQPLDVDKTAQNSTETGLVYLSRIPPFMSPSLLRKLLSGYASIGRIYLAPEDTKATQKRKRFKGNGRKNYTEGWIEFQDRREAKSIAATLNNTLIGGKRSSKYRDNLWNIKFLPDFKWSHLTEQIAYEKQQKQQRLRAEIMQANRESKIYVENVAQSKMISAMEDKKKRKELKLNDEQKVESERSNIRRMFKQRRVVEEIEPQMHETADMKNVMASLFS